MKVRPDVAAPAQRGVWAYLPDAPLEGAGGGPLSGLTFNVKDLFGVEGWPLHASTRAPLPPVPQGPLVTRLLALGAALVGKTHLHEIALGISGANAFGGTPNPLDAARVTGGSSSGAAASVALGLTDFALGTDTGGSIRVPAAWCGVVGFKPGKGDPAWSTDSVLPLSVTCDHAGPLARDLGTVLRVQEALTGQAAAPRSWEGVRVGVWHADGWLDDQARGALLAAAATLESLGAVLTPVQLPDMLDAYSDIVQSEAAAVHRGALARPEPGFTPGTLALLRRGAGLTDSEVRAARDRRDAYRALLDERMTGLDVLLAPAVPCAAPLQGQDSVALPGGPVPLRVAVLRLTVPFSMLGWPTLALPHRTPDGLSVGVQLVARPGQDAALLGLARTLPA
ncbi:amidase [Deinococcus aquiradiocola]|uniref:Amidase n=1 Tax=Deinococcus aquiradiocola TaxID=393059 RepID=A0A917PDN8_9DEIO|nr:amidase [Deinococcus aquiradiocola]GGJ72075.1 amidase [Deinococcus aquiradiocola]